MREQMEEQLMALTENIASNLGYPYVISGLNILKDYNFYFDICSITFPEFNSKIQSIHLTIQLAPHLKLQKLLELLTSELQINFIVLSAQQILKGNFLHIYNFLKIIQEFTEAPPLKKVPPKDRFRSRLHTCPSFYQQEKKAQQFFSERVQTKIREITQQIQQNLERLNQNVQNDQIYQNNQTSKISKKSKDSKQLSKNCKQQKKTVKVFKSIKGIKKKKMPSLSKINQKPKLELKKMPKISNKKSFNENTGKKGSQLSSLKKIKQIDDFFKSFQYKLRDYKCMYLNKMGKLIKQRQNERMRIIEKINLQHTIELRKREQKLFANIINEHQHKISILRRRAQSNTEAMIMIKKEQEKKMRKSLMEIKQRKKLELQQIKNNIMVINNRMLIRLQQGGQMQKMVKDIYKKF